MSHQGKVCIITGATDGIGKEAALNLAKMGFTLGLVGRNPEKIDAIHIIATSGMKMGMNVNIMKNGGKVVTNPHPKDLSKSLTLVGFFVSPTFFCINPYILL